MAQNEKNRKMSRVKNFTLMTRCLLREAGLRDV